MSNIHSMTSQCDRTFAIHREVCYTVAQNKFNTSLTLTRYNSRLTHTKGRDAKSTQQNLLCTEMCAIKLNPCSKLCEKEPMQYKALKKINAKIFQLNNLHTLSL